MPGTSSQLKMKSLEGHAVKAFIFFCAACPETTVQFSGTESSPVDLPSAIRWARDAGWAKRGELWHCPACLERKKATIRAIHKVGGM